MSYLNLIDDHKNVIITGSQVEMEYKKNRQVVILESQGKFKNPDWNNLTVPALLSETDEAKKIIELRKEVTAQQAKISKDIVYKPFGPVKGWMFGNGQQRAIQYDNQLNIERILSTNVQDLNYQYDLSGNIKSLDNLRYDKFYNYGYDPLNRLTAIGGSDLESYEYDSLGNRLSGDDFIKSDSYHIATDSNRLLSVSNGNESRVFGYDANGNITSDESANVSKQFTYNTENRMSTVKFNDKTTTYMYNTHGKRVSKTLEDGTQYHYIYSASGQLIAESKNGKVTKEYIYLNGQLVGLFQNEKLYFVHTDHLGRPEIVTDKRQNTVWQANNRAFDRDVIVDNINGLNIGFPGQYWDEEKLSWYNGFRDYDSTIGRYLQSDPIGVNGGINTYNYVLGNPLVLIDLQGLLPAGGPGGGIDDEPSGSSSYTPSSYYDNVIVPSLNSIGKYSEQAAQLMLAIAIHESNLIYDKQIGGGPALGLMQIEPATHDDIWNNVISINSDLESKVNALLGSSTKLSALQHNDIYGVAMARIFFTRFSEPLPALGDVQGMAEYWKKYYNTPGGAGTIEKFMNDWYRITGCVPQ